jgi:hypothetical protein
MNQKLEAEKRSNCEKHLKTTMIQIKKQINTKRTLQSLVEIPVDTCETDWTESLSLGLSHPQG